MKRLLLSAAIAATLAPNAFGQVYEVPSENADEIISIGQRIGGTQIDKLTAPVSVLSEADIAARGQQHVTELLRSIPGIAVSPTGSVGQMTQIRVRGSEANQVLVLIDGVEVANPNGGEFDFAGLRAADIVRIETLRGEQSAIYGSDAIAGVINIITRAGDTRQGWRASVEAGSFGTVDGQISAVIPLIDGASLSLNANAFNTEGYDLSDSDGVDEGSDSTSFNVGLNGVKLGGAELSGKIALTNRAADLGGPFDSINDNIDTETFSARLDARFDLGGFEHLITGQTVNTDTVTESSFPSRSIGERFNANWAAKRGFGNSEITVLGEVEQETYELVSSNLETPDNVVFAFAGDYNYNRGPITVTGSGRYDINERFGDQITWRAGAGYAFDNFGGRLRGSIGTGVKNPSLIELFGFEPGLNFDGNPDLEPETSLGYSVGYTQEIGSFNFSVDIFRSELENEITTIFGTFQDVFPFAQLTNSTVDNLDTDSTREGIEVEAQWTVADNLSLRGAATFLDAEQNGAPEVRRADFIGSASATYSPVNALRITATLDHNGEQLDAGRTLDEFTLVGLNAAYDLNEHFTVTLRGDNLFDEDYQEVFGFAGQGRGVFGGISAKF